MKSSNRRISPKEVIVVSIRRQGSLATAQENRGIRGHKVSGSRLLFRVTLEVAPCDLCRVRMLFVPRLLSNAHVTPVRLVEHLTRLAGDDRVEA